MNESVLSSLPYIPGTPKKGPELLSRYLPPISEGVVSTWLKNNIDPGSWILDPFAALPRLPLEAAHAGYRILIAANNPISRFLIDLAANPPTTTELKSALAELAASYKADERIEPHIRSLFDTRCTRCGRVISADAFLWEQGAPSPVAKIYTCPFCGESGEHPTTPFDADRVKQFSVSGIHRARALERVISSTDQDRIHVEQALSVYLPRSLYALITIINKLEGLKLSDNEKKCLWALLLHAFDQTNAMWKDPPSQERRRQLTLPRRFRENNTWVALEQGIELLSMQRGISSIHQSIPITNWPNLPPDTGGICVYQGRLANIADSLPQLKIKSICTAIPRPNQAFWMLSALWSGWLWGREALSSFKSVLHRQRYDWAWHTNALASIFKQLVVILEPSTKIFGLIGESEPGFIASALTAASFSGCSLEGVALRNEEDQAQIVWKTMSPGKLENTFLVPDELGAKSAKSYLENRGEPASYLQTITSALIPTIDAIVAGDFVTPSKDLKISSLSKQDRPNPENPPETTPSMTYTQVMNAARNALSYRSGFLHFNLQNTSILESITKDESNQAKMFTLETDENQLEIDEGSEEDSSVEILDLMNEKGRTSRATEISESEMLWLRDAENANKQPISDQYELFILNYLTQHPTVNYEQLDQALCTQFHGLYTPDPGFIHICINSYGEKTTPESNEWHLRSEDKTGDRLIDLDAIQHYLRQIGERLGIQTLQNQSDKISSITWEDNKGEYNYKFFPTTTANIGEIVFANQRIKEKAYIIIPGSRANLIIYKLRRDPRLFRSFNPAIGNWRFIKFRHVKSLAENPSLNRENLEQFIKLDPLTFTTPQLRLI